MAYFIVTRLATGTGKTADELESILGAAHQVVVTYSDGMRDYLHGGEAEIWYAGKHDEYAVKVYGPSCWNRAEDEFEKFELLHNNHHVAKVYCLGFLVDNNSVRRPALAEEHVTGKTLYSLFPHDSPQRPTTPRLDAEATLAISLELAHALTSISLAGIAHRDISPSNVLLKNRRPMDPIPQKTELMLIDFGSAAYIQDPDASILYSQPRFGSVPYASPEMFGSEYAGQTVVVGNSIREIRNSPLVDVWSLGAMITFLMAGEYWPPEIWDIRDRGFGATGNYVDEMKRIVDAKRAPIDLATLISRQRRLTTWDSKLCDLVSKCTDFDPYTRMDLTGVSRSLHDLANEFDRERELRRAEEEMRSDKPMPVTPKAPGFLIDIARPNMALGNYYAHSEIVTDATGCRFVIQGSVLTRCLEATTRVQVPDGVGSIGEKAFIGNTSIERVDLPSTVTSIGRLAFKGANQLRHISMVGVEQIGSEAFADCTALQRVDAPRVGVVKKVAFARCAALKTVSLPSLTHVGKFAFFRCVSLTEVFMGSPGSIEDWSFGECRSLREIRMDRITSLGNYVFANCAALEAVSAPNVQDVGRSAFLNCFALRDVSLPSATNVGAFAFFHCRNIVTADLSNAARVEERAFCGCSSMVRIKLDATTTLGAHAFDGCASLIRPLRRGGSQSSSFWRYRTQPT